MSKDQGENLHAWNAMAFSARLEMANRFHATGHKQLPQQQLRKAAQGKGVVTGEKHLPRAQFCAHTDQTCCPSEDAEALKLPVIPLLPCAQQNDCLLHSRHCASTRDTPREASTTNGMDVMQ